LRFYFIKGHIYYESRASNLIGTDLIKCKVIKLFELEGSLEKLWPNNKNDLYLNDLSLDMIDIALSKE